MSPDGWIQHSLALPEVELAYSEKGSGPAVLLLHGGPGDDSQSLVALGDALARQFRCVRYDQRGSGRSRLLAPPSETTLSLERFRSDLEALRERLALERLDLVGHSWGALLGLSYAIAFPDRVRRLALVGMAPLNDEYGAITTSNLAIGLSAEELSRMNELRSRRRAAALAGDLPGQRSAHEAIVEILAKRWFVSPEARSRYLESQRGKSLYNGIVSMHLWPQAMREFRDLDPLKRVRAEVLVQYGYQDYCPITQADEVRRRIPAAKLSLLNDCSHFPWLDQPEQCLSALSAFLAGAVSGA